MQPTSSPSVESVRAQESDDGYPQLEKLIRERIASVNESLFLTDAKGLFEIYLNNLPEDRRQHYQCKCCRRFIEKYGSLATIQEDGSWSSAIWGASEGVPEFFASAVSDLNGEVRSSKIIGVFLSSEKTWGVEQNKGPDGTIWTHLSGVPSQPFSHAIKTDGQMMAEKIQDFQTLIHGVTEFSTHVVQQAVRVLEADAVDRSEKTLGVAKWLLDLRQKIDGTKNRKAQENFVWKTVATAPPGFCHVRSTMISTLLDDINRGLDFEVIKKRWSDKMHPLQYQRPTAEVSEGAVKQAEEIVAKLKSAGSLERRFAKLEDIQTIWKPGKLPEVAERLAGQSVFGHLLGKNARPTEIELPTKVMTWKLFRDSVLPKALSIEYYVSPLRTGYVGLVTAVNADAPPILQWDSDSRRNPVSWYFYSGGSHPSDWHLPVGEWVNVNAVSVMPPHWCESDKFTHHAEGAIFVLEGCRDLRHEKGGGFFPENLRSEYHGVRSVMEKFANKASIAGRDEGTANGICFHKQAHNWGTSDLRVKTADGFERYRLDRLE